MVDTSFEFPQIIKDAVKSLANDTRWKITEYLVSNGSVSYSRLLNELRIPNKGSLTFHLDALSKGAIIERRENFGERTEEKVFYDISPLGKDIINGLLSALAPMQTTILPQEEAQMSAAAIQPDKNRRFRIKTETEEPRILTPITAV